MSIFQKLGFVKKDEVVDVPTTQEQPVFQKTFSNSTVNISTSDISKVDYNKHFENLLEKSNQPGFDFFEFQKILIGLEGKPLQEEQKYDTAFISASSMGVSPADLIKSGNFYLDVLTKEEVDFKAAIAAAQEAQVTSKQIQITNLTEQNKQLLSQIEANNQTSQQLNREVLEATNKLNTEQTSFSNTLSYLRTIITDRISKIQLYLNANITK